MKLSLSLMSLMLILTIVPPVFSQEKVSGRIVENVKNDKIPLPYANVYWQGTTTGSVSDENGQFKLNRIPGNNTLIASYVGYINDTIILKSGQKKVEVVLQPGSELAEVEIKQRMAGTFISSIKPIKTEVITTAGLTKLACCNLSESFENNATVDVGFSDAVTGAKQIQMLGLAGVYSQLMVENIPFTRGLGAAFGLTYIPGTWMESIQVSKGSSSVINGFESMTGQINAEFRKPFDMDRFYLNLYGNNEGRLELNSHASHVFAEDKWSTAVLAHVSGQFKRIDMNDDGFLDQPLSRQLNLSNRWSYEKHGVTESKFGINFLYDERNGGQLMNLQTKEAIEQGKYVIDLVTKRVQIYDKTGFVFPGLENTSLGLIFSGLYHDQQSVFGPRDYNA
ncbi:MAG TPA: TonB-dependent receptor, partial [Bacteroidales bacterium]|nr:TonB-dependent receptor [Bacteroidales bacterium]